MYFIREVELIGLCCVVISVYLVPVFCPLLTVLLPGEPFAAYQAVGIVSVLSDIWLAERRRRSAVVRTS